MRSIAAARVARFNGPAGRARQHAANAAARVRDVARVARDQVHVDMHPRLAAGLADVDADVVTVRRMLGLDLPLHRVQQREHARLLAGRHVEEVGDVASWNDDHVAAAQRVAVVAHVREVVVQHDIGGGTQFAFHFGASKDSRVDNEMYDRAPAL
jgi:hypothetical protein